MTDSVAPPSRHPLHPTKGDEREWTNSLICRETLDGKTHLHIPPGIEPAKHLKEVVDLTTDLLTMKLPQGAPGEPAPARFSSQLDDDLQRALRLSPAQLIEHFPKHCFHPYAELFVQCAASERLFDYKALGKALSRAEQSDYANARQRMLDALRKGAREPKFRRRVKAHRDRVNRNLKVIRQYTDAQFRHARVLVIRVDCLFNDGFAPAHDWLRARAYREALIKYFNRDLPKAIQPKKDKEAGKKPTPISDYLIGTEYGIETGWHFHVTLFLNGEVHKNHVGIASLICSTWMLKITGGYGRYYNCNLMAEKGHYGSQEGVGTIDRDDNVKREILRSKVATYGGKGCYYAEAQTGTKDRLLNKGAWPKEKDPRKGGRPEKLAQTRCMLLTQVFSEKKKRFAPIWARHEPSQPRMNY